MKKIILSCFVALALVTITGCSSDNATHRTTTTSQETTVRSPVTTTTTDTKTTP